MTIFPTDIAGLYGIALPTPFEIGPVNCYVAEGDPLTLIDCGTSTEETYRALVNGLADRSHRVSDIRRLIITHHHTDHMGLARRIVDESGAEVWAHSLAVRWLETPQEARKNLTAFTNVLFRESGVPQAQIDLMNKTGKHLDNLSSGSVPVAEWLDEGDTLDMAGLRWTVFHTPGHAGDMLCFYQPDSKVLLASDHLLQDVSSNPLIEAPETPGGERPKRLLDYMREMQRIAALGARIGYTGHGRPIDDICKLVESRLSFHQKRADKLRASFDGQPRLLYDLTRMMFPTVPDVQLYLTLSEVLGHLDLLERDGRVTRELRAGLLYWQPM